EGGVEIIAGPLLAGEVRTVAPVAQEAGVSVIAFSSDRTVAGNGIYLLSFTPEDEVRSITRFAVHRGHSSFAALIPQTPYGEAVRKAFSAAVSENGGQITELVT